MTETLPNINVKNEAVLDQFTSHIVDFVKIAFDNARLNIPQIKQGLEKCMLAVTALPEIEYIDAQCIQKAAEDKLRQCFDWDDDSEVQRAYEAVTSIVSGYFTLWECVK